MIKKITSTCIVLLMLLSISIIPVSAEDATESEETFVVNQWTWQNWKTYFDDIDLTKYDFDYLRDVSYDYNLLTFSKNSVSNLRGYFINADTLTLTTNDLLYADNCTKYSLFNFSINSFTDQTIPYNSSLGKSVFNIGMQYNPNISFVNNNYIWIISDYEVYKSFSTAYPDFSNQIFYCSNPVKSFLDYFDNCNLDFNNIVPPECFNSTGIKYYSWTDSPHGKYQIDPYETLTENWCNSGLFADIPVYYSSDMIQDEKSFAYEHNEKIKFYIPYKATGDSGTQGTLGAKLSFTELKSYNTTEDESKKEEFENYLTELFETHFRAVHYENAVFTPLEFFDNYYSDNVTKYSQFITVEELGNPLDGTYDYYFTFTLNSRYTYIESTEDGKSSWLSGNRVVHTCSPIDPDSGDIGINTDGLGSDISQADDTVSRPPTRDELKDLGFENGYQNKEGSFPFKVTIYRNGIEYFQMYFSKKPSVSAYYYSDKCIDYGINIDNMKIYMYFKEQNMSKVFDFTDETINDMNKTDIIIDDIVNPIDVLGDEGIRLFRSLLNVDTSEFNNTYTIHMWTNYSGIYPSNYNGFYCKFNWDLETSGHFQKNNSDDDYDYSQDYEPDEGFTDNNGNIHGGAVETPTETPNYNGFNNSDFTFDENNLWGYANSFLGFCARAFKLLPAFIWQLIACSIVVIIILRVLGR